MIRIRNPCIVLEDVASEGAYNANCPRAITSYWRDVWHNKRGRDPAQAGTQGHDAHATEASG
jgi:hypothetical protein